MCDGARKQQLRVERGGFGRIGQQRTVPFDAGAAVDERVGHRCTPARRSRVEIRDHTPAQVIVGTAVGAIVGGGLYTALI